MSLELNEEYGTVHGYGRARYFQNGKYYAANGDEIIMSPNGYELEGDKEDIPGDPEAEKANRKEADALENYKTQNWRQIKEKVIELGGEWSNKKDGIDYLLSLDG